MSPLYLILLLVLLGCMVLVDRRWHLAFWRDARRAGVVLVAGVTLLLVIDILGVALGVFYRAQTWAMTGLVIGPELPIEEPCFLAFLVYLTMNLVAALASALRTPVR